MSDEVALLLLEELQKLNATALQISSQFELTNAIGTFGLLCIGICVGVVLMGALWRQL